MFAVIVFIGSLFIESAKLTWIHTANQFSISAFHEKIYQLENSHKEPCYLFLTCSQVGTSPLHCPSEHLRVWRLISRETLLEMIMNSVFQSINLDLRIPTMNHGNDYEQCFPKYQLRGEDPKPYLRSLGPSRLRPSEQVYTALPSST